MPRRAAPIAARACAPASAQQYTPPLEGVYTEIPLSGIFWFNSHAFNLTEEDTVLEARVNWYYATELEREMRAVNVIDANDIAGGTAPFHARGLLQQACGAAELQPRDHDRPHAPPRRALLGHRRDWPRDLRELRLQRPRVQTLRAVATACTTDRDCDGAPGANDGDCDACPITAGQTTENEMFVLMPWYVLPPK